MKIFKNLQKNKGMTYVELIVILTIFATLSAVVIFNYSAFQSRIDIKNLSSDIALKIIDAQKSSVSGIIPARSFTSTWRPSYGVYFNPSADNKSFYYFTDLDQAGDYDASACPGTGECIEKVSITKGNSISSLSVYYQGDTTPHSLADLTITFIRPNSSAIIKSATSFTGTVNYAQISVVSPKGATSNINVYPSGKVEIK